MKKIYLSASLVVFTFFAFAQSTKKDSLTKQDSTKIIKKYLPANIASSVASTLLSAYDAPNNLLKLTPPNVASMEQYGNLPINSSTGQLGYTLPLYTINVGDGLSIPLVLAHNNTGLKPDQVPSWVGNGWDMSVGGNIVQYIKGINDFGTGGLQTTNSELLNYVNGTTTGADKYAYSTRVVEGTKDSQYDIFSVNLLGRNTKFYFNGSTVVFLQYMPLKVDYNTSNQVFTVTDERAFVYTFALSITNSGSFSDGFITGNTDPFIASAITWYLTKITTPSGVEVLFNYTQDIAYEIAANHEAYKVGAEATGANSSICQYNYQFLNAAQSSNVIINQYLPSSIIWKGKQVVFDTSPRNDLVNENNLKAKVLSKIKVYDESNNLIKQIGFTYDYMNSNDRLQLQSVGFLDNVNNVAVQTHSYEYYPSSQAIPIPSLKIQGGFQPINYKIDHWGYYNGKNNSSKIPQANYSLVTSSNSTNFGTANRASDGDASKAGMLKKINYPTNGYTEISYEPNTVNFSSYASIPFFMKSQHSVSYSTFFDSGIKDCSMGTVTGIFTVPQTIVAAKITWLLQTSSLEDQSSFQLSLNNSPPYIINEYGQSLTTGEMITDLTPGTYYYTLYPGCVTQAASVVAQASFKIEQPVTPSGGIDLSVGGNRVTKVIDYDGTNTYNERTITYENANLLDIPFYVSTIEVGYGIGNLTNNCILCGTNYIVGENNVYAWDGFHVEYLKAIESMGINGANGKKVSQFQASTYVGGPITNSPYPSALNLSWRSGSLINDETYRKDASIFTKMEEMSKVYFPLNIFPIPINQNGVKIGRKRTCPVETSEQPIYPDDYFNSGLQPVFSDRFAISSETSNYYADGKISSNTKTNTYNSDWLLQKTSTTNSKNQTVDVINYYPNDYNSNIANTQITSLKNIHAIGIPLKTIKNVDNKTVEGVLAKTDAVGNPIALYRFENNNLITHAHNASVFYDSDFKLYESRQYSSKGNIVEMIGRNGTPKTFIWAYQHSYPIAEITNATKAQVEAQVGSLETIANYTTDTQIEGVGTSLSSNLTTAFTNSAVLKSGIGIKKLTAPTGIQSTFDYDNFTRLKSINDNSGYLLKQYSYQYAATSTGGSGCTVPTPTITAAAAPTGCSTILTASACTGGTINWTNGQTGTSITVPSVISPLYSATCTTTCMSPASNSLAGLTMPVSWNAVDLGSPSVSGCLVLDNNTVKMRANTSGGIGGTANDTHYYFNKQFSGNVTIVAKLNNLTSAANIRAGLIFKAGLGARDVFFSIVQDGNNTVGKLHRSQTNDPVSIWQFDTNTPAGVWVKIKKVNNVIQSYYSTAANPSISNDTGWTEFLPNTFGVAPSMTWGTNFQVGFTLEIPPAANTPTAQVLFTNIQIDDNGSISNL